ncbi:MAG: hypothetical protein RDV41_13685 [Planctomycetota bacterium]|nr:hypothetical protein [Planctomycetota bacterium]
MSTLTRGMVALIGAALLGLVALALYAEGDPFDWNEPLLAGDSDAVKQYNQSEAEYMGQLYTEIKNRREAAKALLDNTYADSASIEGAWESWKEATGSNLDSTTWDHVVDTQALGDDGPKAEANFAERAKIRKGVADALYAEEAKNKLAFAIKLSQQAVKLGDGMNAQWVLRQVIAGNSVEELPELNKAVEDVAKCYEEWMFKTFTAKTVYADYETGSGCGCVFSDKPFPEKIEGPIQPICKALFKGSTEVHVLCRLPQAAKAYDGYTNGRIYLDLICDSDGFKTNLESKLIGTPKAIGDTPYVRATFKLPPAKFEKNKRWWFRVQASIVFNKPLESGDFREDLTSDGIFFWLR